jgi:uncharacterized protein (TIGR00369 family)
MNLLTGLTLEQAQRYLIGTVPHTQAMGTLIREFAPGRVVFELPYSEKLIGDPDTGVIHGGAITTLFDAACGNAVLSGLRELRRIVTLDLRIDYLRPARPGASVICVGEAYRYTHEVVFVRGSAHDGNPDDLLATASGTFMLLEPVTPRQLGKVPS